MDSNTVYHGTHEYSTFSASTIWISSPENRYVSNNCRLKKYICFLCELSSSLILHPVGPFRCIWDMFVMLLLIYTSIEIPFTMSFGATDAALYISVSIDCFLFIDILFNFHTAYFDIYDRLRLVTNKKYICAKYFRTWFFIDLITCIPFQLIFHLTPANSQNENALTNYIKILRVFRLLRILKILRFLKMLRIFDTFMRQFVVREVIVCMKILKIIFGMVLFAHFAACLWWFVGTKTSPSWIDVKGLRSDSHSTFTKYSYSWYWAVVTLFTTGYGDIVATNITEQWVCSICILVGTCFFAYFVGTLTVFITEGDKIKAYQSDKLEEAQSFCEKKKLPKELARAILTHIRYHCTYNYVFDESELLSILPAYLQHDIHSYVAKQFLLQLNIFNNEYIHLSDFIIGLIAVKCKSISCNQSYKLYEIGDIAKEFYIQRTGKSVMYNKQGQIIQQLARGNVCGEFSSILFKKRKTKIECLTWSEFYSINTDEIRQVLDIYYPKSSQTKWNAIKKYLKMAYKHNKRHRVEIKQFVNYDMKHDINAQKPSFKQKSISIFYQAPPLKEHEESIHLFNNTKLTNKSQLYSHNHTPIPPLYSDIEIDNEDMDDDEVAHARAKLKLKRPKSYEYSLAVHQHMSPDHHEAEAQKKEKEKERRASITTKGVTQKQTRRRSAKFDFKPIAKFHIRSNSEVRDSVIVAHAEKHRASVHLESTPKQPNHLQKSKTAPPLRGSQVQLLSKEEMKAIELGAINFKMSSHRALFTDVRDSECSYFSSSSSGESSGDENKRLKRKKYSAAVKNTKKKTSYKRKGKAGKFGARGARNKVNRMKAKDLLNRQNSVTRSKRKKSKKSEKKNASVSLEKDEDIVPKQNTFLYGQSSIDESLLLASLKPKQRESVTQNEEKKKIAIKPMKININGINHIAHEEDHNDGKITPLTYMTVIKSNSAVLPQATNVFDIHYNYNDIHYSDDSD